MYNQVHAASVVIALGNVAENAVGRFLVTVFDEGSMNVSIVPEGTAIGSGKAKTGVAYANANAPDTSINPGSTPITAAGNYLIEASGMDVDLDLTVNAGSVRIIAVPVRG